MATIRINKNVSYFTVEQNTQGIVSTPQGIQYGRNFYYQNNNWFEAYIPFDISQLSRSKITKVTLSRVRTSLSATEHDPATTGIDVYITAFKSSDVNVPQPIPYNLSKVQTLSSISIVAEKTTSGTLQNDITSILKQEDAVGGIIGIKLNASRSGSIGFAIDSDVYLDIEYSLLTPMAPKELLPRTTQNPRGSIVFSWWHTPNPNLSVDDPQIASELTVWQTGVTPKVFTISGTSNTYTLSANTFTAYNTVYFTVRTQTQYNGWGTMSATASFPLGTTPPRQPILVFPRQNTSVNGESGVLLEWEYNSAYDTKPSRFDIRYRFVGTTTWTTQTNQGRLSAMTDKINVQQKVEWQVMAYGELGDPGLWSETGLFFTIGIPAAPTIVRVENSNRPTVFFSALSISSWDLRINQGINVIYQTGNHPFENVFFHRLTEFIGNGNYIARLRVTNGYGLQSAWVELPFTVNATTQSALQLKIVDNPDFNIRLHFNNSGKTVYIYRSELRKNRYLRIAKTTGNVFDDYTVRPKQRYEYFCRVTDANNNFADSNIQNGSLSFMQTTIAEYDNPQNMLFLLWQIGSKPTKNGSFEIEESFTQFIGRSRPVSQIGELTSKNISLSFYCTIEEYERLEKFKENGKILIIRDWRFDTIYGRINGPISFSREIDGWVISFAFIRTDFNEEVPLD